MIQFYPQKSLSSFFLFILYYIWLYGMTTRDPFSMHSGAARTVLEIEVRADLTLKYY